MGNIGDSISDSSPALGTAGTGYAETINSLLTEFKNRLVAKIPLSSLILNDDFDLNGQAVIDAAYITLINESVSPVASPINRLAAYAGNLWWVSPTGAAQLTAGNQLNAAGIGGITGDYSTSGASFYYDNVTKTYKALDDGGDWAIVATGGTDLYPNNTTSAFKVRLRAAGTLASNYSVIFPDSGLPADPSLVTISSSGVLSYTNTLFSGQSITIATDAEYKHGPKTKAVDLVAGAVIPSGTLSTSVSSNAIFATLSSGGNMSVKLPLRVGERLLSIRLVGDSTQDGTVTLFTQAGNVASSLAATSDGNTFPANGYKTMTVDAPAALTLNVDNDAEANILHIVAGADALQFGLATITYDRP